jgi:ATP-binding protein involved in chromosome partitioning
MSDAVGVTQEEVVQALRQAQLPQIGGDPVSRGMVRDIRICDGNVAFDILLPPPAAHLKAAIERTCQAAVMRVPGVRLVDVRFAGGMPQQEQPPGLPGAPGRVGSASPQWL